MKFFVVFVLLVCAALGDDDGKYRPEVTKPVEIPTTARSIVPVIPTTRAPWNTWNSWNSRRYEPRPYDSPRPYDPRTYDPRAYDPRPFDSRAVVDSRFNPIYGKLPTARPYYDYRTIRLDEKVDAKGYKYVYETVGGILAEEVGTFVNIGLKNEGVRTSGYVQITDVNGVSYRIDYQTESKDAFVPRGDSYEAPRTPPQIIKLLGLLESHK